MFLDKINTVQRESIDRLRKTLEWSHHTDVVVRKDGQEYHFEADWLRDALDFLAIPSNWKHEFLFTKDAIDKLLERHLHDSDGAVQELLVHHLRKASELLFVDVNGGLDDEYAGELEALRKSQEEVL